MNGTDYTKSFRHSLWQMLAGTRGGMTRIRILLLLRKRPYNMNQLHENLNMDYKTIQHHIRVLIDSRIIETEDEKKYGCVYFLSPFLERNMDMLDEITDKIGKKQIKRGRKNKW